MRGSFRGRKTDNRPTRDVDEEPDPFQGCDYRILTGQGANVAGGRRSYLDGGLMTRGFAVVAWPATCGNSGIMTFVVNHAGVVFEKDLGPDTGKIAAAITESDPDRTWKPTSRPSDDESLRRRASVDGVIAPLMGRRDQQVADGILIPGNGALRQREVCSSRRPSEWRSGPA